MSIKKNLLMELQMELQSITNKGRIRSVYAAHAIVLSEYDNGKVKAVDPASSYTTGKWYDINTIWNQRSTDPYDTSIGGAFVQIGQ